MNWKRTADDPPVVPPEPTESLGTDPNPFSLYDTDEDGVSAAPDVTSLSIPSFPAFAEPRRGLIRAEEVQTWYHDIVVPKYLEILEQSKAIQAQRQTEQQRLQQGQTVLDHLQAENARLHQLVDAAARDTPADPDSPVVEARAYANALVADAEAENAVKREQAEADVQAIRDRVDQEAKTQLGELYTVWRDFQQARATVQQVTATSVEGLQEVVQTLLAVAAHLAQPIPESAIDPAASTEAPASTNRSTLDPADGALREDAPAASPSHPSAPS